MNTADHIILTCPTYRASREIMGLTVLDDETRCHQRDGVVVGRSGVHSLRRVIPKDFKK